MNNEIMYLNLDDIIPNRFQPREVFDETALNELSDSIKKHGVLQPILVRMVGNKYEIIAGERRYKASVLAGLSKIPVIIKQMDDKESSVVAYIENAQRKNVSAIEEAKTCKRILDSNNLTQEELARELGITQSTLANKLRLLSLPMEIQESLMKNEISERHARSLLSIKDPNKQIEMLNKIKEKRMTVRELDNEIKTMDGVNNMDGFESMNNNTNTNMFFVDENKDNNSLFGINDNFSNMGLNNETNNNSFAPNSFNQTPIISNTIPSFDDIKEVPDDNLIEDNNTFDINKYRLGDYNESSLNEGTNTETKTTTSFMDYLNNETDNILPPVNVSSDSNLDTKTNVFFDNTDVPSINIPNTDINNNGFNNSDTSNTDYMSFLDKYENTNINSEEEKIINLDHDNSVSPDNSLISNVSINDTINPPISTFNEQKSYYVEDQDNFNDFTNKVETYDTVDTILLELKGTIDRIKNSKYKIDTEEIDYGDIYQITIKINKNEQL